MFGCISSKPLTICSPLGVRQRKPPVSTVRGGPTSDRSTASCSGYTHSLNVCGWYARVARRTGGRDHEFARRIRDRQAANVRKGWALLEAKGFPTESGQAIAAEFMAAVDALPMLREVAEIDG